MRVAWSNVLSIIRQFGSGTRVGKTLFAVMHERYKQMYRLLLQYPGEMVFDYEDTSTIVMNCSMYVDYKAPCINDYAVLMHRTGKLFIAHMCGKLSGFYLKSEPGGS